jgi:hypothetical protein
MVPFFAYRSRFDSGVEPGETQTQTSAIGRSLPHT